MSGGLSLEAVDALVAASTALGDTVPSAIATYYLAEPDGKRSARRYDLERLRELRESGVDLR